MISSALAGKKKIPLGSGLVFEEISSLVSCLITSHYFLHSDSSLCPINFNIFHLSLSNNWIILLVNNRTHVKLWMMSSYSIFPTKSTERYVMASISVAWGIHMWLAPLQLLLRKHYTQWFQREERGNWKEHLMNVLKIGNLSEPQFPPW